MERNRWLLVFGTALAVFMASLDMSIVNVALPAIEEDFGTRTSVVEWTILGYLLPVVALALPSGRWLNQVGFRPALVFAVAGFAVSSVVAGLAPGIGWLIAARVVQGAFAAIMFTLIPALTTTAVRPEVRGRAMGLVTTLGPFGLACGPAVGGVLVDNLGWPWIFYVNIPVSLLIIVIGLTQIPSGQPLRAPDRGLVADSLLLAVAMVALMLGLSLAADGATDGGLVWLALIVVAAPPLVLWWRRGGAAVHTLLKTPGVSGPHLALISSSTAIAIVLFLMPFYLMRVLSFAPVAAGVTILAFPLAMAVLGPLGGALADWWGARRTAIAGAVVFTAGLALLVPMSRSWTSADVMWRLAVAGLGNGLFNAPNMTMAMTSAPRPMLATAGASTSLVRQLGFALGPALATVIWALYGYAPGGMSVAVGFGAVVSLLAILALSRTTSPSASPPDQADRADEATADRSSGRSAGSDARKPE